MKTSIEKVKWPPIPGYSDVKITGEMTLTEEALYEAGSDLQHHMEQMVDYALSIKAKMDEVIDRLQRFGMQSGINTLGEMQCTGLKFEIMCGEYGRLIEQHRRISRMTKKASK